MNKEIISIINAGVALKGSIRGTIIKKGDEKSGPNGQWKRQELEIEDKSGSVKMTVWNADVDKFELGNTYELITPQWTVYKDVTQVQPSKYGSYTCVGKKVVDAQTNMEESFGPRESPGVLSTNPPSKLPPIESSIGQTVRANTLLIAQIEHEVFQTLDDLFGSTPRGEKVAMYTRMNFYFLKGIKEPD